MVGTGLLSSLTGGGVVYWIAVGKLGAVFAAKADLERLDAKSSKAHERIDGTQKQVDQMDGRVNANDRAIRDFASNQKEISANLRRLGEDVVRSTTILDQLQKRANGGTK